MTMFSILSWRCVPAPHHDTIGTEMSESGCSAAPLLAVHNLASAHAGPVSFALAGGECLAIVGTSGSGKSVMLRMLADLLPATGEVRLNGTPRERWAAPAWRSMVVYQAAEPAWWEPTAGAHFAPEQAALTADLMGALHLAPALLQAELAHLSTGERQRLALIRSLARRPKVLLLDEPAASLDFDSTVALEAVLQGALGEGMAIIIVTHAEQQAARMANRCLRMHQGRLVPA